MRLVIANQATASKRRVYFHLVDVSDGLTAETGEASGQPQISTNGGAFTDTGIGTLTHLGNGRYYADLTQAAVATAGDTIQTRYKSANTAECPGDSVQVVAIDLDTAAVTANVTQISGDSTAADNLEAQYDGTGYINGNGPAYQSQIAALSGGVGINVSAAGSTVISGTETGTYTNMAADDDTRYVVTADAGTGALEFIIKTTPSATTDTPVDLHFHGYYDEATGATNGCAVRAYNFQTAAWDTLETLTNANADQSHDESLTTSHKAAAAGTVETVSVAIGDVLVKFIQTSNEIGSTVNLDHFAIKFVGGGTNAAAIADAVWDEATADHQTAGSTGEAVYTASDYASGAYDFSLEAAKAVALVGPTGLPLQSGTVTSATSTSTAASFANSSMENATNAYRGYRLLLTTGTGYNQSRLVTASTSAGGQAATFTHAAWTVTPSASDRIMLVRPTTTAYQDVTSASFGAELLTVTAQDEDTNAIQGATVYAHNSSGEEVGRGVTDANGQVVLKPGTGVITVSAQLSGYSFTSTSATVSAGSNQTATISATTTATPAASDPGECAVYATLRNLAGTVQSGVTGYARVVALPEVVSTNFYVGSEVSASSNGSGVISWDLPRGSTCHIRIPLYEPGRKVVVPAASSAELSTL